ncbi:hypothetical protein EV648_105183 [Kribbella sp. VKM Ac-2568]|nr:hypothetical protein EV648_105183 [Kribbella sp. VKM Ac-2568]
MAVGDQGRNGQRSILHEAIWRTPVPSSPPASDPYREALGLNLLALALRLDHVDRLSESLHLVDSTHMTRSVAVDINLARLTDAQRKALRASPHDTAAKPKSIWLPLGRTARTDLAPIQVKDSAGAMLTTITHRATVRALGQGLRRAFMIWLDSNPDAHRPGHELQRLRHTLYRSSWLIEAALTNLIENGSQPAVRHQSVSDPGVTRSVQIRQTAHEAVDILFAAPDNPFLSLLEMVSSEHLLVVEVDASQDHAVLRYDAPVLPALESDTQGSRFAKRRWRPPSWASLEHEFTVTYETVIPRAVNSYHATVEVPEELRVRRLLMTSDNDAYAVRLLIGDMHALADQYETLAATAPNVLELELQAIVSRAAELGRRRHGDLAAYHGYVRACYRTFTHRLPKFRSPAKKPPDAKKLCHDLGTPGRTLERLWQLSELSETTDDLRELTTKLTPEILTNWAEQIGTAELHLDIHVDNDPRENAGHTHWSRRSFGPSQLSAEPVKATVYAAFVDDPPSLAASVGRLLFAVVALVVALATFLEIGPSDLAHALVDGPKGTPATAAGTAQGGVSPSGPISTADALVTILLLVPGLLLSRLDIPSHQTVLGRLRLFSRYVAYAAVSVATGLALCVATRRNDDLAFPLVISLILLALIVAFVLLDGGIKAYKRRSRVPNKEAVPRWLIADIRRKPRPKRRTAAEFSTVGRSSHV